MTEIQALYAWKGVRFLVGLTVTLTFALLGFFHGRSLQRQGITGEDQAKARQFTLVNACRDLLLTAIIVGIFYAVDNRYGLLMIIAGYVHQGALVAIKSVLAFMIFSQWQVWSDKARLKRSLWIIVPAFVIITAVELYLLWPVLGQLGKEEIDKSGVVLQTTGSTCAPACLATLLRLYGKPITEAEAVLAMGIGSNGSYDDEMVRGAKAVGFSAARAEKRATLEGIAAIDRPLILSIKYFGEWDLHAVGLLGLTSDTLYIADPLIGLREYDRRTFHEHWRGPAVHLGPPDFCPTSTVRLSTFSPGAFKASSLAMCPPRGPRPGGPSPEGASRTATTPLPEEGVATVIATPQVGSEALFSPVVATGSEVTSPPTASRPAVPGDAPPTPVSTPRVASDASAP